jgi:molecular chaperone DnaK
MRRRGPRRWWPTRGRRKDDTPLDRFRELTAELQQIYQGLGAAASAPPQDQQPGAPQGGDDDDVIDAEFTAHE